MNNVVFDDERNWKLEIVRSMKDGGCWRNSLPESKHYCNALSISAAGVHGTLIWAMNVVASTLCSSSPTLTLSFWRVKFLWPERNKRSLGSERHDGFYFHIWGTWWGRSYWTATRCHMCDLFWTVQKQPHLLRGASSSRCSSLFIYQRLNANRINSTTTAPNLSYECMSLLGAPSQAWRRAITERSFP